jgi:hypothetical protein
MNEKIKELIERVDQRIPTYPDTELITVHRGQLETEITGLIKAIADVVTEIDYGAMTAREVMDRAVEIINSFGGEHGNKDK